MPISTYATTAAGNNTGGALFPENQLPSTVNDGLRQMQADVRNWYESAEWVDLGFTPTYASVTSFTVTGDKTSYFVVGRRVRLSDAVTLYGTIASSAYVTNTTVTVTLDSGSLTASLSAVAVSILSSTNSTPLDIVTLTRTQTLTNKTLTSPVLTTPQVTSGGSINSTLGTEYLNFVNRTSAVNNFQIENATTGNAPFLTTIGDDANIPMGFQCKGTGTFNYLGTSTSAAKLRVGEQSTNGTNYIELSAPASITSNVSFTLPSADGSANQVLKTDGAGNLGFVFTNRPAFIARKASGVQSFGAGVTAKVTFDTEDLDTGNCFDNTTNYRFTPNIAGYYNIGARISGASSSDRWYLRLYKNGVQINSNYNDYDGGNGAFVVQGNYMVQMNGSTDYLEIFATNAGTGTDNIEANNDTLFFGYLLNI